MLIVSRITLKVEIDMENRFKPLQCNDDDVLAFNTAKLLKFSQFKEKLKQTIRSRLGYLFRKEKHPNSKIEDYLINFCRTINFEGVEFGSFDIKMTWKSAREGIDCEILRLGSKSWQKGKLRSHADIELFPEEKELVETRAVIQLTIEFSSNEPEVEATQASNETSQTESPLDDLRQMINQETKQ